MERYSLGNDAIRREGRACRCGDPGQQKMMMFMPLIFGFMFYNFPSGLVLYYLTSNLVNIGQQLFFNNTAAADDAALSVQPVKKKKVGK